MNLHFEYTLPLLALPLLILLTAVITLRSKQEVSPIRFRLLIFARSAVILFFVLALAEPHIVTSTVKKRMAIFLLDVSESVTDDAKKEALDYISKSQCAKAALVLFAGKAQVIVQGDNMPLKLSADDVEKILYKNSLKNLESGSKIESIQRWKEEIETKRTDPSQAIRLARLLYQSDYDNRIILMTDGNFQQHFEPERDISLVPIGTDSPEVLVRKLDVPQLNYYGKPFNAGLLIDSNIQTEAELRVSTDSVWLPELTQKIKLSKGENHFVIKNIDPKPAMTRGIHSVTVIISPLQDTEKRNNLGTAALHVIGKQSGIIFKGPTENDAQLLKILGGQDIDLIVEEARNFPMLKGTLTDFDLVIFIGVPENRIIEKGINELSSYVNDLGGGVLLCASHSMTKSDLESSLLQKILPVNFSKDQPIGKDTPTSNSTDVKVQAPQISLLFLIDKSGSMAGKNLTIAKEACIESAKSLSAEDNVSVIAFDAKAHLIVPPTKAGELTTIEDKVLRMFADGGTDIYAGLELASNVLSAVKTSVKHVVLLSDGMALPAKYEEILTEMLSKGITLSSICIGSEEFDLVLMSHLAKLGKGRSMFTSSFAKIPQILINETRHVVKETRPEPKNPPSNHANNGQRGLLTKLGIKDSHEILSGVKTSEIPHITGYIKSIAKSHTYSVIVTEDQTPIICVGRYGLGKSAFFATDTAERWSSDFFLWNGSSKIVTQLVRHLSRISGDRLATRVYTSATHDEVTIRVEKDKEKIVEARITEPESRLLSPYTRINEVLYLFKMTRPEIPYKVFIKSGDETALVSVLMPYEPEFSAIGKNSDFAMRYKDKIGLPPESSTETTFPLQSLLAILGLGSLTIAVMLRRFNL